MAPKPWLIYIATLNIYEHRYVMPAVISLLALIVVLSLLYNWGNLCSSGAEQQTLPPKYLMTIRVETSNVADQLQAVASLQAVRGARSLRIHPGV